ncbi:hypothetical protein L1887_38768 [Cichorium endivia]|nr:hypothetical protein L1887_38768 [Cichorium endivia]
MLQSLKLQSITESPDIIHQFHSSVCNKTGAQSISFIDFTTDIDYYNLHHNCSQCYNYIAIDLQLQLHRNRVYSYNTSQSVYCLLQSLKLQSIIEAPDIIHRFHSSVCNRTEAQSISFIDFTTDIDYYNLHHNCSQWFVPISY